MSLNCELQKEKKRKKEKEKKVNYNYQFDEVLSKWNHLVIKRTHDGIIN
jgi:hypothetical protein